MSTISAEPGDLDTWRALPAAQQPDWPDPERVRVATAELAAQPPLVFAGECDQLKERLAAVARGEVFVLQGGDCAETFAGSTADAVRDKLQTLLQMAVVLTYAASVPVVKIGRVAGQFAKPRSSPTESRDGVELPSYRGEAVNGLDFTPEARIPDPERMLQAYHCAAVTLNLSRAFTSGGYADLHEVHRWNQDFVAESPAGQRYERLAGEIDRALAFMKACGADAEELHGVEFYSSHEGLLLEYERALTRIDSRTGLAYDTSAHLVWIGERTRDVDGAHVEFFSRVRNPIGVKLGPTASPDDAIALVERLNPEREPGRLTFITRMGAGRVREVLPPLVEAVARHGSPGRVDLRPDAREHVRDPERPQDPPSGGHLRRGGGLLRGPPRARHPSGRHPRRVHRRRRDRVRRRRPRGRRGRPAPPLRDGVRPAAQPPPVARPGVHGRRALSRAAVGVGAVAEVRRARFAYLYLPV